MDTATNWRALKITILSFTLDRTLDHTLYARIKITSPLQKKGGLIRKQTSDFEPGESDWNTTFQIGGSELDSSNLRNSISLTVAITILQRKFIQDRSLVCHSESINLIQTEFPLRKTVELVLEPLGILGTLRFEINHVIYDPSVTVDTLSEAIFPNSKGISSKDFQLLMESFDPSHVNLRDKDSSTLLYKATKAGKLALVKQLLENPDIITTGFQSLNSTVVHAAHNKGHCEILDLLLSNGVQPECDRAGIAPYQEEPKANGKKIQEVWKRYYPDLLLPTLTGIKNNAGKKARAASLSNIISEYTTGKILDLQWKMNKSKIMQSETSTPAVDGHYRNNEDHVVEHNVTISQKVRVQKSCYFEKGLALGGHLEAKINIPTLVKGKIITGAIGSMSLSKNQITTEERTLSKTYLISVPPFSTVEATARIFINQFEVPFVAKIEKIHRSDPRLNKIEEVSGLYQDATNVLIHLQQHVTYHKEDNIIEILQGLSDEIKEHLFQVITQT